MEVKITFRKAKKADIPHLIDLMNAYYKRKKTEQYFFWQYFNSVYPAVLIIALADKKVIGIFGLQKRKLTNSAALGQAIDLLVSSEWRGKGIFKRLAEKALNYFSGIDAFCVFPNLQGKIACEKGLGWKTLGKINSLFLRNKIKETVEVIKSYKPKQELIKFKYNSGIRKWRFEQNPVYKYSKVKINSGKFAIVKIFKDSQAKKCYGDVVDFGCNINDGLTLRKLFLEANLYLRKKGAKVITTRALPDTHLHKIVKSLGFIEVPQERFFCLKVLNPKYQNLYNFSKWHLVQADAEIY